jgi:hypothetical protein
MFWHEDRRGTGNAFVDAGTAVLNGKPRADERLAVSG